MREAGPEDLSPYRDSYAPAWANEELASWEPAYPAWSYSDFGSDRATILAAYLPESDLLAAAARSTTARARRLFRPGSSRA